MRRSALLSLAAMALFFAAASAGYWVSSQFGRDAVRGEIEQQLSRVLRGEVTARSASLRFRPRPVLALADVTVDYPAPGEGALRASGATAGIDPFALLTGRFRLEWLRIEGLRLRAERGPIGPWSPPFLEPRRDDVQPATGPLEVEERWLDPLRWLEGLTRLLLARPWAARRLQIVDGRLDLRDTRPVGDADPVLASLQDVDIDIQHDWLLGRPRLQASAAVASPAGPSGTLTLSGERTRRGGLQLSIALQTVPIGPFEPYASRVDPGGEFRGALTGVVDFSSPERGHGRAELDLLVEDARAGLRIGGGRLRLDTQRFALAGAVEVSPRTLRIEGLEARGPRLGFDAAVVAERPLGPQARVELQLDLLDIGPSTAARVVATLPPADADPARAALERVRTGHIRRLGLRGTTVISEWRQLAGGSLPELPPGIRVAARVEDLTIATGSGEDGDAALRDLSADLDWQGQRIAVRDLRARWRGEPLPRIDVVAHGVRHLLAGPPDGDPIAPGAEELPGLPALWELLGGGSAGGTAPAIELEIDELHHPGLPWPLRAALARVQPIVGGGLELSLPRAHLGGIPISVSASLVRQPERALDVSVSVGAWEGAAAGADGPTPVAQAEPDPDLELTLALARRIGEEAGPTPIVWARGRLRTGKLRGPLPAKTLESELALAGTVLRIPRLTAALEAGGRAELRGAVDLAQVGVVDANAVIELAQADLNTVGAALRLPEGFAHGVLDVKGAFAGQLRPGTPLLRELTGALEIDARDGHIERGIPLVSALAHASEGFNPFAARHVLRFETLRGMIELDHGRIASENLEVDGPVRVFASGEIEFVPENSRVEALVGIFVLRHADLLLGDLPVVRWLVPGSDRGLLGAYFKVTGPLEGPVVSTHAARSLSGGLPLPDVVRAPFEALQAIGALLGEEGKSTGPRERRRSRMRRSSDGRTDARNGS